MTISDLFPDFAALQSTGFAGIKCAKPAVMIAMTPRTGSSHLCAALEKAGDVGVPRESFNPRGFIGEEKQLRQVETFAAYIKSFEEQPGRHFVFKTCWIDLAPIGSAIRSIFPSLQVIYLSREKIVEQAVSFFRAQISGQWARLPGEAVKMSDELRGLFDLKRICAIIHDLETEKRAWERFFLAEAIFPKRLFYETFTLDIDKGLRFVADQTDIPLRRDLGPDIGHEKLADGLSREWAEIVLRHDLKMT